MRGDGSADPLALARPDLLRDGAFIYGLWVEPREDVFEVLDPADGRLITRVLDCDADLAASAADAACRAFETWRETTGRRRADHLRAWFEAVIRNAEDLARLISLEQGKPLAEARAEVSYGAAYLEWFAEEARRIHGDVIPSPFTGRRMKALVEPVGVCAVVTPWNFPLAMIARKVAPALAAGCTIIAKPAEDTPLTALALAFLAEEAGLPPGVFNVVPASRVRAASVVDVWLDDPRVRKLSFTGSTAVGKHLAARAATTLKRVSLELGGDAPVLVFDDADLDLAVEGVMKAKFRNAGQACIAANRIYVQDGIFETFVARLTAATAALRVGAARDGAADIGPLINARAAAKVVELVAEALQGGARVRVGGDLHPRGAGFYAPTILTNVAADARLAREEIFGPVASVTRFIGEDEAVTLANATPYGLAAYAFTSDARRIARLEVRLEAGMVGINEGAISTEVAPFGGIKASGYGREGSRHGLADYQHLKYICEGGL